MGQAAECAMLEGGYDKSIIVIRTAIFSVRGACNGRCSVSITSVIYAFGRQN
jgi:hypothetical protein